MKKLIKQFWIEFIIIITFLSLILWNVLYNLNPALQIVFKKIFLVSLWYLLTYAFRKFRLGTLEWDNEKDKKIYYYILLISTALIFAFS